MFVIKFINDGGPLMYPLLLCSIIGLAFIIERLVAYRSFSDDRLELERDIEQALGEGGPGKAASILTGRPGAVSRVLKALFDNAPRGPAAMRKAVSEEVELNIMPELGRRLSLLASIGKLSPLIGLFGTVQGMIGAFDIIGNANEVSPKDLSHQISIALNTTFAGLLVAIPVLAFLSYFRARVNQFSLQIEKSRLWALDTLAAQAEGGASKARFDGSTARAR